MSPMDKAESMKNIQMILKKDGQPKEEPKIISRDEKHYNRMKNGFDGLLVDGKWPRQESLSLRVS